MARVNSNYQNLSDIYLFSEISKRTKAFAEKHPGVEIMRLGLGDTTQPLPHVVIKGLMDGVDKLANVKTYTGYGNEQGDSRLREYLAKWYKQQGIYFDPSEIFISDGAKPDSANILSIFDEKSIVALQDPVYPVYADAATISGREIVYMPCNEKNHFIPSPPSPSRRFSEPETSEKVDIIYICSPNNPTGSVLNKKQLRTFVDYCIKNKAVLIFDAAYFAFIQNPDLPRSIYEIPNAKKCAIEINSFSKFAGFTGVRLGWTVVPNDLVVEETSSFRHSGKQSASRIDPGLARTTTENGLIRSLWRRRQTTMFNGASNIAQEGGLAVLSTTGWKECMKVVDYYMENAKIVKDALVKLGLTVYGGDNAPYIWMKTPASPTRLAAKRETTSRGGPKGTTSWEFFDTLLNKCHVVTTPGSGFGPSGEGYVRLSAFGHRQDIQKAVESIEKNLKPQ